MSAGVPSAAYGMFYLTQEQIAALKGVLDADRHWRDGAASRTPHPDSIPALIAAAQARMAEERV